MAPLSKAQLWDRFQKRYTEFSTLGLAVDLSRMNFPDGYFDAQKGSIQSAFDAMAALEKGAIANPDEKRMVGHYWLRQPDIAPTPALKKEIVDTVDSIRIFAREVHLGMVQGEKGKFEHVLVIGIGGSALGPQLVAQALGKPLADKMSVSFFDNTDPDGMDLVLAPLLKRLGQTLCVVISKSGGTKETRNGMLEAQAAYAKAGLKFGAHAVAVTGLGSELDQVAVKEGWIKRFPMWDWVGGRTSELSAVGLLPAALQGIDIGQMLAGAAAADECTRIPNVAANPAAQLALAWHYVGKGRGEKDMVILPYKDRLVLFSKYLQQLIMESLGKELDLNGKVVNQGIAVYGNKGSTDQHAYVQQLREGLHNFFVTFIEVLQDRESDSMQVEPGVTSGDYLSGFYLGTRQALYEKDRESITLTVQSVTPFTVGVLIALFERTVGLYAALVNINAYHQPGVEAGKKAAGAVIALQGKVASLLSSKRGTPFTASQIAEAIGSDDCEAVFKICQHLSQNPGRGVKKVASGTTPAQVQFAGA